MRRAMAVLTCLWLTVLALPGHAEPPVVVELFTSQGCSSCPPADAFLHELAKRDDVIALALHVDYWDYIGWKDIFASPGNTRRQHAYAYAAGRRSVYTPQMIVGGKDHVVGTHARDVEALIARHLAQPDPVQMTLQRQGDAVRIIAKAVRPLANPLVLQLVRFKEQASVAIKRGENAGKVLSYANIVTEWREVARWDGRAPLSLSVAAPGPQAVAVLLQQPKHGPIVAAARLP